MTAPLPALPDIFYERFAPACGMNVCEETRNYAKLAVREALERATDAMHHAGVNTWEDAVLILRAMIEEYK